MNKIKVTELKPGDNFSEDVYIDTDNVFIKANAPIKKHDLERLSKWGISEVLTRGIKQKPVEADEKLSPIIVKKEEATTTVMR